MRTEADLHEQAAELGVVERLVFVSESLIAHPRGLN